MNDYLKALVMRTVQESNILPVTSACNVSCLFCSHRQNPPGVQAYRIPTQSADEILDLIQWLDPARKVVIGESATRIIEGEPLLHPQIRDILRGLRRRVPRAPLQITSNGSLLSPEMVRLLSEIQPVTVCLSLNSCNPANRHTLMRDARPEKAVAAAALLGSADIPFEGSVVALPGIVGWDDLRETIGHLGRAGARVVRVFMPGFTRLAPDEMRFPHGFGAQLAAWLDDTRSVMEAPVVLEPPLLSDLTPYVRGVIAGSPAMNAGLRAGDIILQINGREPWSRVEAHRLLTAFGRPAVVFVRDGDVRTVDLDKPAGVSAGLVFDYDFDPEQLNLIRRVIRRSKRPSLVVTGSLAAGMMHTVLAQDIEDGHCRVLTVPNRFFGGSIGCAGLLVVNDIYEAVASCLAEDPDFKPECVVLPSVAFDYRGADIAGRHYREIEDGLRITVRLL